MAEEETVLTLKVRGVSEDIEEQLHRDGLSQELFEGLEALCEANDVAYRSFGLSVSEEPVKEFPSRDSDPVDVVVDGWEGGKVRHTGGGIFCREFYHSEKHLEVVYNADTPEQGVSLYAKQWDDDYEEWMNFGEELDGSADVEDDEDALEVAEVLMRRASEGEYDDAIAAIRGE